MKREAKLTLRQKNGTYKDYIIDFVSESQRLEYIRLEAELEERVDEKGTPIKPTDLDYSAVQTKFVANLFGVKEKEILDGLDSLDRNQVYEIIRYRVLGFNKEEDERLKKALMEANLDGVTSTTSN
ncbi:phage tail assembly chaperone G [Enterococcus sp. JM9B]|uniref:phage tail assembly chaperone G n=1 Tax=Enterococcus sp. JM9B TaxID=1857216 RepID=UPI00192A1CAB|nr:hypothetical protein [Enterococcus sp. JM9B]